MYNLLFFQNITFVLLSLAFLIVDCMTGKQNKYNYVTLVSISLFQLYFVSLPFGVAFVHIYNYYGQFDAIENNAAQLVRFAACMLIEEILFYYIHRILHIGWFYLRFHKLHHQIVIPVAVSTLYVNTVEHIVLNLMPVLIAPWLCALQGNMLYLWFLLTNFTSIVSHCGYAWIPGAQFHEDHHRQRWCNFGVLGIMDLIHGTRRTSTKKIKLL